MLSPGIIDFEDLYTTQAFAAVSLPYLHAGFSLTTDDPEGITVVGTKAIQYLGTTALVAGSAAVVTLTRTDGKPFALVGINLSSYNGHSGVVYAFAGQKSDGTTVTDDISLQNQGLEFLPYLLPPSFDNLLSVTWIMNTADTAQYFDDIRYSYCSGG